MKFLRVVLSIVFLIIAILVLAMISLVLFVDPNKLKPVITEQIVEKTGYKVNMQSNFSWSFYPHFSVLVPDLTLSKSATAAPFIHLHNVKIATSFLNLLFKSDQFEGTVDIATADFVNLHATNGHIHVFWQHNMLMLEPIRADLYSGNVKGVLNIQLQDTVPHWKWDATFYKVNLASLITDVYGASARLIEGNAQIRLQGVSEGVTKESILSRLNGVVAFTVDQGSIVPASNLNDLLQQAQAWLNKDNYPSTRNVTAFDQLTGSAFIDHGMATCNNINVTAPLYLINGNGSFNLLSQDINLNLHVKSQPNSTLAWEVPVTVNGPISQPHINVNIKTLRKSIPKQEIKKAKEKIRDQILKHISGHDADRLRQLLGQ